VGYVVIIAAILALVFGPGLWVRRVLERYSSPADRYAGTGAQLARYLLNKHGLQSVAVETTDQGDHYDPTAKAVRLTPEKFEGHSLTAITVAAHEVGHAIQDKQGYAPLRFRTYLVRVARPVERMSESAQAR
jgi:Zn-dependent membrane protease YugP